MAVGVLYDDLFLEHRDTFRAHPECPDRLVSIREAVKKTRLTDRTLSRKARPALAEELSAVHTQGYIERLERELPGRAGNLDLDTFYAPQSWDAALNAAGGTMDLAVDVLQGNDDLVRGLCLVRPPGHHAEADRAMGFCLLNNIALGATAALAAGAKKVAIVDWDVHHGNGTQHAFDQRADVLFMSAHRYPFYPGTGGLEEIGGGPGTGFTVNAPMAPRLGDEDIIAVFDRVFIPIIAQFEPDIILLSSGFDAHEADPLGDMMITDDGFRECARKLCVAANNVCQGRLLGVLEGGYNVDALGRCCVGLLEEMLLDQTDEVGYSGDMGSVTPYTDQMIDRLKHQLAPHWRL